MQNLALHIDREDPQTDPEVQEIVRGELTEAGITILDMAIFMRSCGEVPTSLKGERCQWLFERAWTYWVAKGPGVPPEAAEEFDKSWGKEVRANGDCACRGPLFWNEGFGTDCYHIDTQEGLNAFVTFLNSLHRPRKS